MDKSKCCGVAAAISRKEVVDVDGKCEDCWK